jgi:hypothetical protein
MRMGITQQTPIKFRSLGNTSKTYILINRNIDKFLDANELQKLKQEDLNPRNRSITSNDIDVVMKNLPTKY